MAGDLWYRARTLESLGAAVAGIRGARGLTQTELGARSGSSRPTISRIERGEPASDETVLQALAAMGYELVAVPRGAVLKVEKAS